MDGDLTLTVTGDGDSIHEFMRMIAWMDLCSQIGHSTKFDISYFARSMPAKLHFTILEENSEYQKIVKEFRDYLFDEHVEPYEFRM